jgi:hypothetical protein
MKEIIAKMVRFTTEGGMVECVAVGDAKSNTSTIKHTLPHVMGVPLRIVSSQQGNQKKKIYSQLKSKAGMVKRRKEQRNKGKHYERRWVDYLVDRHVHWVKYIGRIDYYTVKYIGYIMYQTVYNIGWSIYKVH